MGGTGEWLNELALELEHRAAEGTGGDTALAAVVVGVVAARIVIAAPGDRRGEVRRKGEDAYRATLEEHALGERKEG